MATWEVIVAIAGLAVITVLTRGFFILPERELPMPDWLREACATPPSARWWR